MSTNYYDAENNKLIKISGKGDFPADYGTKAEFESKKDSLPDGTVFTTTDEFVDAYVENYSTNEVVIGKWIDGKPLYRKCIKLTNIISDAEIDLTYLSIDKLLEIGGFVEDSSMIVGIGNYYTSGFCNLGAFYRKSDKHIKFQKDANINNTNNGYLILQYTKTN